MSETEKARDARMEKDLQSPEEGSEDSSLNITLIESLQDMEASFNGSFDCNRVSSVHELKENEEVHLTNMIARSGKRFETAVGANLVKNDCIKMKPVNNAKNQPCKVFIAISELIGEI